MKKIAIPIFALCLILTFTSCQVYDMPEEEVADVLGIDTSGGTLITYNDTHGGPHGDGQTYTSISFDSDKTAKEISQNSLWKPFPLSENINTLIYGSPEEETGPIFETEKQEPIFPEIKNGYYYFLDKQAEKENMYDDAHVLDDDRYSFNFVIAIYDTDTDTLHYAVIDT